jgi:ribonuclease HI
MRGDVERWEGMEGVWQGRKMFMDRKKEVFDAEEVHAIWMGLTAARDHEDDCAAFGPNAVIIFTHAQAALERIRNDDPGPGQWRVRCILRTERQLRQAGWTTEYLWVPGHKWNEVADEWAKDAAVGYAGL